MVVNLSGGQSKGLVRLPWGDVHDRSTFLEDLFSGAHYNREGNEMAEPGLFVDLPAWGSIFSRFASIEP